MKPTDRQKMCANCDGRVPFEAIVCPYCSADLAKAQEVEVQRDVGAKHQAIQDSLTSLYTPPYQQKAAKEKKQEPQKTAYTPRESRTPSLSQSVGTQDTALQDPAQAKTVKTILISILTLSIGSLLLILGVLQVFFAEEGMLRLEWDATHWFIYCLAALPLLYYGYRSAQFD